MIFEIIKEFSPWILYFIILGPQQGRIDLAIIAASAAFIFLDFKNLKKFFIQSWGTALYFLFMFISVVIMKNQWVVKHAWVFSNGTLALISWVSLLIGKPFTEQYAKEIVPKEKWGLPIFKQINKILTSAWGSVFLFNMLMHLLLVYGVIEEHWVCEVMTETITFSAIGFTTSFPNWYRSRKLKAT